MNYSDVFSKPRDYTELFKTPENESKNSDNGNYMNLFGDESEVPAVQQTAQVNNKADSFSDLFSNSKKSELSEYLLFDNPQAVGRALRQPSNPMIIEFPEHSDKFVQQPPQKQLPAQSGLHIDFPMYDVETVREKFKKFLTENEVLTNNLIDLSQEMQLEHDKIEKKYLQISAIVDEIKTELTPKTTWLKKEIPINKQLVHQLIDKAQQSSKDKFTVNPFLMTNLQNVTSKSGECFRIIEHLEKCVEQSVNSGAMKSDDPLYSRIVTTRKMMELQKISTEKTLSLLNASYDKIEAFRQNTLVIILIEAQTKLI
jgi:hypothetical protein